MENDERERKIMKNAKKNTGKRGKREEKWRKTNEKPRKSQGKSEETVPTTKKNKIPKTRKNNSPKKSAPEWYIGIDSDR